ncbi:putative ribonuclease H-like domain-containing protein, partial [Tanacetum coccineum]
WIFNVDSLTKSMNYVPVVAGNKTNGPKVSEEDAGIKPTKVNESKDDVGKKPIEVDDSRDLDKGRKDDQDTRSEFERLIQQEKQSEHPNSTNSINIVSTPVSVAGPSFTNNDPSSLVNTAEPFSPFKHVFELSHVSNVSPMDDTGIFDGAYDDEDVGAEADINNLETTMNVSSIPTTRIYKDHPLEQVIGDFHSAPLTRRQSQQNLEELGLEPKKVIQALADPSWVEAMQDELLQFKLLNVWTLVDLPKDKWAIGTKWVFRNKKDERGIVVKNKARLVAQGHTQEEGIDYDEVFAPVARIEAIRLFLAYASFKDFVVYQMDVNSAFLYGKIEEEVYVCQPPNFEDPNFPDKVYKGKIEEEVYVCQPTDFEDPNFSDKVYKKDDVIFISQDKYVAEILKKFDFATIKTSNTPIEPNKPLLKDEEVEDVDVNLYRSMIGSLMYLTASRPDIMFAVYACARFQVTPKVFHLHAV